ncbi:hypothetical protein EDD15DRAFT_1358614 [Pisolithus albus]|nr:hypothetical protein EDD15DRAFT_1358614 [Pisolithus albus]
MFVWQVIAVLRGSTYSLFRIFNVRLAVPVHGESFGHVLGRLLLEIVPQSARVSVLNWAREPSPFHSSFPAHITSYRRPLALSLYPAIEEQPSTMMSPIAFRRCSSKPETCIQQATWTIFTHLLACPAQGFSTASSYIPVLPIVLSTHKRKCCIVWGKPMT